MVPAFLYGIKFAQERVKALLAFKPLQSVLRADEAGEV